MLVGKQGLSLKQPTVQKASIFGVILVRIFPHLDYIRESLKSEILKSPYSVQMLENADQNNSGYGHFLRSDWGRFISVVLDKFYCTL